eukprot:GFUD01050660.1.p1 GENE.GFUD01050660.1~~GFUD01050660.1.p1  ORF type:complete len:151 (+),score=44.64 GFUD01050660.1:2-454(+)
MFYLFGINIVEPVENGGPSMYSGTNQTYGTIVLSNRTWEETPFGWADERNATDIEDDAVISESLAGIPGLPFLIASVCVVFAIIASFFLKDITKGTIRDEVPEENTNQSNSNSNSQSETDSQTKVNIKSSVTDVQEFVEAEHVKSNLRKC